MMEIKKYCIVLFAIMLATSVSAQSKKALARQLEASQEKVEQLETELTQLRTRLEKANQSLKDALSNNTDQVDVNAVLSSTNNDLLNRVNKEKRRADIASHQVDSLLRIVNLLQMDSDFIINPKTQKDSVIAVLQPFYAAKIWEDRLDYILQPKELKSAMAVHYDNYPTRAIIKPGSVIFLEPDSTDTSLHKVGIQNDIIYLRKVDNNYKIDWAASHGLNQTSPKGFKEVKHEDAKEFRVIASLSNRYLPPYANKKQDYWSIELSTIFPKEEFNAYVLKDSEEGQAIHKLLEDNNTKRIIVKMARDLEDKSGNVTKITEFVQEDWSKEL